MKPLDLCQVLLVNTTLPSSVEFRADVKTSDFLIMIKRSDRSGPSRRPVPKAIDVFENFLQQLSLSASGYRYARIFPPLKKSQVGAGVFSLEFSVAFCSTSRTKASTLRVIRDHPQTCFSADLSAKVYRSPCCTLTFSPGFPISVGVYTIHPVTSARNVLAFLTRSFPSRLLIHSSVTFTLAPLLKETAEHSFPSGY